MTTRPDDRQVAQVREVFDAWARHGRADGMARSHWPFARQALERLHLAPSSWFLDIGCGTGYAVCWAARAAPEGRAVGVDVAEAMVHRARELCVGLPNADFHVAQFPTQHTLPAERFDGVFSMEVFYYLPDLDAALRETLRLLRPGGRFACVVDFYGENVASHGWPEDVGVPMTLLDAAGWRAAFANAGFTDTVQERLRVPPEEASEPWKATEGSLCTIGRRP
jgi:ubiquinone/menaquinone biosynthesis C-methylase UbiE